VRLVRLTAPSSYLTLVILKGPPFTHPTLPNYAHFIGSTTPRSSPAHYLDAVQALVETYRLDIQTPAIESVDEADSRIQDRIPLVVNTMGWAKGLGADLTQKIEDFVDATRIFDIQAPVREEYPVSVPVVPTEDRYSAYYSHASVDATSAAIHVLEPITPFSAAAGYTAADHRSLSILSYLHAEFPLDAVPGELEQITARSWDTSRPLCAIPPYEVDCAIALDKIVLTGAGSEDVVEEEIGHVLNAALVGLVRCEPGTLDLDPPTPSASSAAGVPYTREHPPPPPASSACVGLALVRGVSPPKRDAHGTPTTRHLQLLTPLPHALLAQARVLVKGEMELPVWGMLDFRNFSGDKDADPGDVAGVEREKVPFLQWGKAPEGVMGAERRRVRRNLMRRGQM
jgi:polynucleotide 5'-hydroxyl-kinase GRC3/NOL9